MFMLRKIIALVLVAGSLVFGFLIIFDRPTHISVQRPQAKPYLPIPAPADSQRQVINSTEKISQGIAEELGNLKAANSEEVDPEEIANKIFSNQIDDIDFSSLNPEIKIADLKIIKSADKKLATNYLKNLQVILKNALAGASISAPDKSADNFKKIASVYQNAAIQLYTLLVPENLAEMHREQIRLFVIQKNIFDNLAAYDRDPVLALVSAKLLPEIDRQFSVLVNDFLAVAKKIN